MCVLADFTTAKEKDVASTILFGILNCVHSAFGFPFIRFPALPSLWLLQLVCIPNDVYAHAP